MSTSLAIGMFLVCPQSAKHRTHSRCPKLRSVAQMENEEENFVTRTWDVFIEQWFPIPSQAQQLNSFKVFALCLNTLFLCEFMGDKQHVYANT